MSHDQETPWWELPGAPGENRTKEQYEAHIAALKEPRFTASSKVGEFTRRAILELKEHEIRQMIEVLTKILP